MLRLLLKVISICSIAISATAQPFSFHDPAWLSIQSSSSAFSPPGPASIANLRYWWHSADMTTNTAVTNWIDEINGSIWTNGAGSLQPTNSSVGVGFSGSTWLSNTAPFSVLTPPLSKTGTVMFVFSLQPSAGAIGGIMNEQSGAKGLYETSGNVLEAFAADGSGTICSFASGVTFDFAAVITNATLGSWKCYTNSIFINVASGTGEWGDNLVQFLGKDAGNNRAKMSVRDILVYFQDLTAGNVSTLHTYFTNLYKYSP